MSLAASTPAAAAVPAGSSTLASLGSMVFSLVIVLALILAIAWVLRRVQGKALSGDATSRPALRVVASLNVGPRERVVVVEAGDTQLLIGVTAQQLTSLGTLTTPIPANASRANVFAALLARHGGNGVA